MRALSACVCCVSLLTWHRNLAFSMRRAAVAAAGGRGAGRGRGGAAGAGGYSIHGMAGMQAPARRAVPKPTSAAQQQEMQRVAR
jgi:hypothetical protein